MVTKCQRAFRPMVDILNIQGGRKNWHHFLTLPHINRFSKLFNCQNQDSGEICNNTIAKDPTTPQVCRYTTL